MSTETTPLKPCPFCGGEAEIERYGNRRMSTMYSCSDCGCRLETGETFSHGAGWNRRVPIARGLVFIEDDGTIRQPTTRDT